MCPGTSTGIYTDGCFSLKFLQLWWVTYKPCKLIYALLRNENEILPVDFIFDAECFHVIINSCQFPEIRRSVSHTSLNRVSNTCMYVLKLRLIWIPFGTGGVHKTVLLRCNFRENLPSDVCTLPKRVLNICIYFQKSSSDLGNVR